MHFCKCSFCGVYRLFLVSTQLRWVWLRASTEAGTKARPLHKHASPCDLAEMARSMLRPYKVKTESRRAVCLPVRGDEVRGDRFKGDATLTEDASFRTGNSLSVRGR